MADLEIDFKFFVEGIFLVRFRYEIYINTFDLKNFHSLCPGFGRDWRHHWQFPRHSLVLQEGD